VKVYGDVERVNLATGERFRRVSGDGESRLVSCCDHTRLGPGIEREREMENNAADSVGSLVRELQRRDAMSAALRLKMSVNSVKIVADTNGDKTQEEIGLNAVYSNEEGSANKQWSKWTPAASLTMTISNPQAFGKLLPGQFVFVDLTPCDKDSI